MFWYDLPELGGWNYGERCGRGGMWLGCGVKVEYAEPPEIANLLAG